MASINFIGGEKGGVGKSVVARLLAQYFIDRRRAFTGFDTDRSHTSFTRFYADYAAPVVVDTYEGLDSIASVYETPPAVGPLPDVIVDLAAQTATPLARWVQDSDLVPLMASMGVSPTLHGYMDMTAREVLLARGALEGFSLAGTTVSQSVAFDYDHGLATPRIYGQRNSEPAITLTAEAILRFGIFEGDAVVHGQRVVVDKFIRLPERLHNIVALRDTRLVAHQQIQDAQLVFCKRRLLTLIRGRSLRHIDQKPRVFVRHFALRLIGAVQNCRNMRKQNLRVIRLGNKIVSSEIHAHQLVDVAVAAGHNNNRHSRFLPDFPAD